MCRNARALHIRGLRWVQISQLGGEGSADDNLVRAHKPEHVTGLFVE